jgi:hypothetical protein
MRNRHNGHKPQPRTILEAYQLTLKGKPFIAKNYVAFLESRCKSIADQLAVGDEQLEMETNRRVNTEKYLNGRLQVVAERTQALVNHLKAYSGFTGDEAIIQDLIAALPVKPGQTQEAPEEEPEKA